MSLRFRIIVVYVLLMAASFSCVIWLILNDVRPRYLEAVEESTVDMAELLAASLAQRPQQAFVEHIRYASRYAGLSTECSGAALAMPRHDELQARYGS